MNKDQMQAAFGGPRRKKQLDEAAAYISKADDEEKKKPALTKSGKEAVSARTMCLSLSVRQAEQIEKIAAVQRRKKAAVVREAIDAYLKKHQQEVQRYDAFWGDEG